MTDEITITPDPSGGFTLTGPEPTGFVTPGRIEKDWEAIIGAREPVPTASLTVEYTTDAKVVLSSFFGLAKSVTFQMKEQRPTARVQAALDELVAAGALSVEPANGYGGVTYKALIDTFEYYRWMGIQIAMNPESVVFPLVEPING